MLGPKAQNPTQAKREANQGHQRQRKLSRNRSRRWKPLRRAWIVYPDKLRGKLAV